MVQAEPTAAICSIHFQIGLHFVAVQEVISMSFTLSAVLHLHLISTLIISSYFQWDFH